MSIAHDRAAIEARSKPVSATPETDAIADKAWDGVSDDYAAYAKMLKHARQLEDKLYESHARELQLREALERIKSGMCNVLECEDIARSAITLPPPPAIHRHAFAWRHCRRRNR